MAMTVVCVSAFTLTSERGTPCHLMRAMAKLVLTIYINPPHSYFRWRKMSKQTDQGVDGTDMKVLTPVLPTTFRFLPRPLRRKMVSALATPLILRKLEGLLHQPVVLWSYLGELTLPLHKWLRADLLCYHRLDDYSVMLPKERPLEAAIEERADLLFAVSPALQQRYWQQGRKAFLLPNGADIAHFAQALSDKVKVPDDLSSIPSPRIGFIGTVDPLWVDTDLLVRLADARPDWSVVVIGPTSGWQPPDALPRNLHLLGKRPYKILPHYLKGLDVCLIPFKDNAVSRAASPLKLYEYLAAGRAVISTTALDPTTLPSVVGRARDLGDFIAAISAMLPLAHDPKEQQLRLAVAAQHSWDQRAETALANVKRALQERVRR